MADTLTTPALVIHRTFAASRERVFDAWIKPDVIRTWFGGPNVSDTEATFDAREGGSYRISMKSSTGEPFVAVGVVTEFRRPERLAMTFRWLEDDPKDEHETYLSIDFAERGNGTEMIFRHENLASDASRERHNEGWTIAFDRIAGNVGKMPSIAVRGIDLSGYMCKDGARAVAFYRDLFGLEPSMVYPDNRGAEFDLPDGTTFGLWGGGGKVMPFQPSNGIMFAVDDLEAALEIVKARGITVIYNGATPNCTLAMINDTEGNILTLHQRKK